MKRDLVCRFRLLVDSLPAPIRNSRLLFKIAHRLFDLPQELYDFRSNYASGGILELLNLYDPYSPLSIGRISKTTDVNSLHMDLISSYFERANPLTFLDAGCGTGYIIQSLLEISNHTSFLGIDFAPPENNITVNVEYRCGNLLQELQKISDNSIEFVLCAHVVEHLSDPKEVVKQLNRITSKCLVVICPLEKEFKWGMNYHVNFFPDKKAFSTFMVSALSADTSKSLDGVMHERLGDIMYVETYS